MQFPELQAAVMCEVEQARAQPPQFATDVLVFVSHVRLLSQSPVPAAQVEGTQAPPESVYPVSQAVQASSLVLVQVTVAQFAMESQAEQTVFEVAVQTLEAYCPVGQVVQAVQAPALEEAE